jgi:DNA adenine methylase
MKPAFSYYGGKQTLSKKIIPLMPNHTVYVEPFCGGASLFFKKPLIQESSYQEVLNDTNSSVVNFFKTLRETPQQLINKLAFSPYSLSDFKTANKIYKNPEEYSDLEKAWAFFIACEQSFASNIGSGWGRSRKLTNQVISWWNKIANLSHCVERMKSVYIENQDALKCIKSWDSPQTLFYLDPPYPGTHCGHYEGYKQHDFEELLYSLKHCQGSFLLSCYPNESVPDKWEKFQFKKRCTVNMNSENTERTEMVWRVDRSNKIEKSLSQLASSFGEILRA